MGNIVAEVANTDILIGFEELTHDLGIFSDGLKILIWGLMLQKCKSRNLSVSLQDLTTIFARLTYGYERFEYLHCKM